MSLSVQITAMELAATVFKGKVWELKAQCTREAWQKDINSEETKLYCWLLDGEVMFRRLKKNTKKFMHYDDSDDDNIIYK